MEEQLGFAFPPPSPPSGRAVGQSDAKAGSGEPTSGDGEPAALSAARLIESLVSVSRRYPRARKLIVGRTRGEAHELLRQLARLHSSWIGFEATTLRPLALEIASPSLAADGILVLDAFEERAILDEAVDRVLLPEPPRRFERLVDSVGFREALAQSIRTLRLVGIEPDRMRDARVADPEKIGVLAAILTEYEGQLRSARRADDAAVLARALRGLRSAIEVGTASPLDDRKIFLLPGLHLRGLAGRFVGHLEQLGAEVLETDPVVGLAVPRAVLWRPGRAQSPLSYLHAPPSSPAPLDEVPRLFAAGSIADELREVLRRVVAEGRRWDEVEIVTTDPQAYGSALHALAQQLSIRVTFAVGLPVDRTSPGRAVAAYFRWLDEGFEAGEIRRLLEADDLRPPSRRPPHGVALARRLRALRIGWGRERYLRAIDDRLKVLRAKPARPTDPGARGRRLDEERRELQALRSIIAPVLRSAPETPERPEDDPPPASPATVARGLAAFLQFVRTRNDVDATAKERIERILQRIAATLTRPTEYAAAAAIVRSHLRIRVPAPRSEGRAPWSSAGGHLHLSDLEHGGVTGRPLTFVVGLDSDRFPAGRLLDPLLLDADRKALAGTGLPVSADRLEERHFQLSALLARLRGSVTLSYAAWSPNEAREIGPAAVMLDAFRLGRGQPSLTFEDLHAALRPLAGPVPRQASGLDTQDVWLGALERQGRLLAGRAEVRAAFRELDAGLRAREAIEAPQANAHHGVIRPRPEELDPRRNPSRTLSASALEDLGSCPRRYLFARVLGLRPPDDPVRDPDLWLDPREKGSLLHVVFERILRERDEAAGWQDGALEAAARRILEEEVERKRREVPAPSGAVVRREVEELAEDVRSFLRMTRAAPRPLALELEFGRGDDPPLPIDIPGGTIFVRGAVDRVDESASGLVVVDYKTGRPYNHGGDAGTFAGGRRLQHVVYTAAVEHLLERSVEAVEFQFPARRGEHACYRYDRRSYGSGWALIARLLDGVAAGRFPPTDSPGDCRFCDFRPICRVPDKLSAEEEPPLLHWASAHWAEAEAFTELRAARTWEGA